MGEGTHFVFGKMTGVAKRGRRQGRADLGNRAVYRQRGWRPERVAWECHVDQCALKPGRRNGERLGWGPEHRWVRDFSNFSDTHIRKYFAHQDQGNTHTHTLKK